MKNSYTFDEKEIDWNNPNKPKEIREILKFRGHLLNTRMKYPLDYKIMLAKRRIRSAIQDYGEKNCYVAFSGGKDSAVLSHLILSMGYKLEHVFSHTLIEYPECVKFVFEWCKKYGLKLTIIKPKMKPYEIWKKFGYPMFSKEIADILERMRLGHRCDPKKVKKVEKVLKRLGYKGDPYDTEKVKNFLRRRGIKISAKCCYYLKKKPFQEWEKKSGKKVAFLGIRAQESQIRRVVWIRKGCIYETDGKIIVTPLIFFTDEDIWKYIKKHRIKLADIYYKGFERNGCYCCGFGCHLTDENNFVKLKQLNPILWKNIMNHWGFEKICKKCKIITE